MVPQSLVDVGCGDQCDVEAVDIAKLVRQLHERSNMALCWERKQNRMWPPLDLHGVQLGITKKIGF